jgi:hypothetical protein
MLSLKKKNPKGGKPAKAAHRHKKISLRLVVNRRQLKSLKVTALKLKKRTASAQSKKT